MYAFSKENFWPKTILDLSNVTVLVKKGKLPQFSHAIEGHLRERLKLPCFLNEGTVELLQDVFLAKDGVRITADQSRLLKLFGNFFYLDYLRPPLTTPDHFLATLDHPWPS